MNDEQTKTIARAIMFVGNGIFIGAMLIYVGLWMNACVGH